MCEIVGYFRFLWSYSSSLQTLRVKRRVFMGHAVGVLEDIRASLADPGESQQWRHLDACECVCVCADSVAVVEERPNQVQHGPHYWRPFTRHHRLFRQRQVRIPTSVTSSATFFIGQIFNGRSCQECRTALSCQISLKSLKPRLRYDDFLSFQDGGRPPSWICNACVGTTHEGHLVVFITVRNLIGIDAVVLIICTFFDFATSAWKRLFMPHNCFF